MNVQTVDLAIRQKDFEEYAKQILAELVEECMNRNLEMSHDGAEMNVGKIAKEYFS